LVEFTAVERPEDGVLGGEPGSVVLTGEELLAADGVWLDSSARLLARVVSVSAAAPADHRVDGGTRCAL